MGAQSMSQTPLQGFVCTISANPHHTLCERASALASYEDKEAQKGKGKEVPGAAQPLAWRCPEGVVPAQRSCSIIKC